MPLCARIGVRSSFGRFDGTQDVRTLRALGRRTSLLRDASYTVTSRRNLWDRTSTRLAGTGWGGGPDRGGDEEDSGDESTDARGPKIPRWGASLLLSALLAACQSMDDEMIAAQTSDAGWVRVDSAPDAAADVLPVADAAVGHDTAIDDATANADGDVDGDDDGDGADGAPEADAAPDATPEDPGLDTPADVENETDGGGVPADVAPDIAALPDTAADADATPGIDTPPDATADDDGDEDIDGDGDDDGDIGGMADPDAAPDAQPDAQPDATPDVAPDATPDVETPPEPNFYDVPGHAVVAFGFNALGGTSISKTQFLEALGAADPAESLPVQFALSPSDTTADPNGIALCYEPEWIITMGFGIACGGLTPPPPLPIAPDNVETLQYTSTNPEDTVTVWTLKPSLETPLESASLLFKTDYTTIHIGLTVTLEADGLPCMYGFGTFWCDDLAD